MGWEVACLQSLEGRPDLVEQPCDHCSGLQTTPLGEASPRAQEKPVRFLDAVSSLCAGLVGKEMQSRRGQRAVGISTAGLPDLETGAGADSVP